jgi:methylenetetrahydrofolate reductase (NADPH)
MVRSIDAYFWSTPGLNSILIATHAGHRVMTSVKAPTTEDRNPIRRIHEIYEEKRGVGQPVISIELFPPKTPRAADSLFEKALPRLATAKPDFFSVTYGAGGGTRDKTLEVVDHIQNHHGITGMAHLTCLGSTKDEVARFLTDASNLDILNILALRGDPPRGLPDVVPPDDGFEYSFQLIDFIQSHGDFSIGAAGFPECHVACTEGRHVDWQRVKNKLDHGAEFILTQLFFSNAHYFEFLEYMTGTLGVSAPVTPGILPILSTDQIRRFTAICGVTLPAELSSRLEAFGDDVDAVRDFGIEFATHQCEELLKGGAPGLHLYSLNQSRSCLAILKNLGLGTTPKVESH